MQYIYTTINNVLIAERYVQWSDSFMNLCNNTFHKTHWIGSYSQQQCSFNVKQFTVCKVMFCICHLQFCTQDYINATIIDLFRFCYSLGHLMDHSKLFPNCKQYIYNISQIFGPYLLWTWCQECELFHSGSSLISHTLALC